jgi:hypothetical protein
MNLRALGFALFPIAVLGSFAACSSTATPDSGGTVDSGTADQSNGGNDSSALDATTDSSVADVKPGSDADADASGPVISSNPLAPTPLVIGQNVTAQLPMDGEHFFEFTPTSTGDHTLHFTSPAGTFYASYAMVKEAHSCGLPSCVQGTGTAALPGLQAGTTYYLNLYNGSVAAGSYTISVTIP